MFNQDQTIEELEDLYQKESDLQVELARYKSGQNRISQQREASVRMKERTVDSINRRLFFAKKHSSSLKSGIEESKRTIVAVTQHNKGLANTGSDLNRKTERANLELARVKTNIKELEQKLYPGDMPLSMFNAQKRNAIGSLVTFMFVEKRTQPDRRHLSYDSYGFDKGKDLLDSNNLLAVYKLIAAYEGDKNSVCQNHQLIVKALSILLSRTSVGRIPVNCRDEMKELAYARHEGKRYTALNSAKNAMSYDEKTAALSQEEPSAMQFYQIQEWMVQILVQCYLARRWKIYENSGDLNEDGSICFPSPPENQQLERADDGYLGLYNFFRSRSKSEARRQHALGTIQLIRQATNVSELMEQLESRISSVQESYFNRSASSHSLDENYHVLMSIVNYADQTTKDAEWKARPTIKSWQSDWLEKEFDGHCSLFPATPTYGLRSHR